MAIAFQAQQWGLKFECSDSSLLLSAANNSYLLSSPSNNADNSHVNSTPFLAKLVQKSRPLEYLKTHRQQPRVRHEVFGSQGPYTLSLVHHCLLKEVDGNCWNISFSHHISDNFFQVRYHLAKSLLATIQVCRGGWTRSFQLRPYHQHHFGSRVTIIV